MAEVPITDLDTAPSVDRAVDVIPIVHSGTTYKITPNATLGLTGDPVGTSDTQTLTNKTLTSPTISGPTLSGTIAGTYTIGGTPTFPSSVVTLTGTQTLTNKTLTSPVINTATIANPTLTVDSISEYSSANGVTIDGLNIKDSALNTANSVPNSALSNTGSFGSAWAWVSWVPTWTNVTVGNGTVTAKYIQIGKTVHFYLRFVLGSTSAISGQPEFSAPVTPTTFATGNVERLFNVHIEDNGTQSYYGRAAFNGASTILVQTMNVAGTYPSAAAITSTVPMTWTTSDRFAVTGTYEAA